MINIHENTYQEAGVAGLRRQISAAARLSVRSAGFSLVEVTLALAIAAFGILTVMGLMPMGIKNVIDASLSVTSSRIFQELVGELESMDWGTYSGGGSYPGWSRMNNLQAGAEDSRRFFDAEGTKISSTDADFDVRLSYVTEFYFPDLPVQVPGVTAGTGTDLRPDMRHVVIRLTASPVPGHVFIIGGPHLERSFTVSRSY